MELERSLKILYQELTTRKQNEKNRNMGANEWKKKKLVEYVNKWANGQMR